MKRTYRLALLTAGLTGAALTAAYALTSADQTFTDTPNSGTNMVGYHVMSLTTDPNNYPFGLSFDLGTLSNYTPKYELGAERTNTDFLLMGRLNGNQNLLQLQGDTGQMALGQGVAHPSSLSSAQLLVQGGGSSAARDGLAVDVWGTQWNSLYLRQKDGVTSRVRINLNDDWRIGTDTSAAVGNTNQDWYLQDAAGGLPIIVNHTSNQTSINNGLAVTGNLGFYGVTPIARPTVVGSRSNGEALRSLLQNLQAMGLIYDNSTP